MQTLTVNAGGVSEQISELRDAFPHSIALSHGDQRLSYEELDRKADRFATYLMQLGIVPGGTVAICMERSFDWIVAALGIMRAGAAYVPLDSVWPDSRLRFAVNDSGATILVARAAMLDRLRVSALGIDPSRDASAIAVATEMVRRSIEPDNLAYVIYTSGSTGVPKGVEITHANLNHLIRWHRDTFNITRQDRASHLLGLGFDAAVLEIWAHLCAGATLCLPDETVRSSPELIQQWIVRERVTVSLLPAILGARLMEMTWPATTILRLLVIGGDALRHGPASQLPFQVVNNYGPTECTVVSTWAALKPGAEGAPPIGFPVAGARVYLLDEASKPVPDGTVGEIYIGGSLVGRGYRNLPELTKVNFLTDPFCPERGARMYRTGDRGVRRPDGEIEFRGRLDRQTKIRGQRVELDEIDSVLTRHPSIDFATAIILTSETGENQLVAYILLKESACLLSPHELREHLLRTLPAYMVPDTFVRLDALPLSPNGKLDLTTLPQPTYTNVPKGATAKAPATQTKEKLLVIAQEILGNEAVAEEDNFFLVGGHSLLGMQLVLQVRTVFGVDLTLRQLFEAPTVKQLARLVDSIRMETRLAAIWTDLLGRPHVGPDDNFLDLGGHLERVAALQERIAKELGKRIPIAELYLSPTLRQQAQLAQGFVKDEPALPPGVLALNLHGTRSSIFWVHYVNGNLANAMGGDQPFIVVTLTAEDLASLGEAPTLKTIAACLLRKVLSTQAVGPYIIAGQCLGGVLAYEIASQLRAVGHEVSLLALLDPPNFSYLESHSPMTRSLSYSHYLLKKAARLGLRISLVKLRMRLLTSLAREARPEPRRSEMGAAQEKIEAAARAYQPEKYEGEVLLLLASDRPPHMNFLPGWQPLIPSNLHTRYVDGHHGELLNKTNVRSVANAVISHLSSRTDKQSVRCGNSFSGTAGLMQTSQS
jgi:amino acid adenylation domain-containing protein